MQVSSAGKRNPLLAWLYRGPSAPEIDFVQVRRYLTYELSSFVCTGEMVGLWGVTQKEVFDYPPDTLVEMSTLSDQLLNVQKNVVFSFAIDPGGDRCAINELDLDGRMKCTLHGYGINTGMLGPVLEQT